METEESFITDSPATESAPTDESYLLDLRLYTSSAGCAEVWRVRHRGKFLILKCLKEECRQQPVWQRLLQREFDTAYTLSHPHIVQTIDLITHPQLGLSIVMEYVEGHTLRHSLQEHALSPNDVQRIALQLCDALDYLHARQVVHRDLKPENILVSLRGGNVKLIDFGFADSDTHAEFKQPAGTLRYAAPEQLTEGAPIDGRTDIYALGKVVGEMAQSLGLGRWSRLQRFARRCCQPNPARRYASAQEAKQALQRRQHHALWYATVLILITCLALLFFFVRPKGEAPTSSVSNSTLTEAGQATTTADLQQPNTPQRQEITTVLQQPNTPQRQEITTVLQQPSMPQQQERQQENQDEEQSTTRQESQEQSYSHPTPLTLAEDIERDPAMRHLYLFTTDLLKNAPPSDTLTSFHLLQLVKEEVRRTISHDNPHYHWYELCATGVLNRLLWNRQQSKSPSSQHSIREPN